MSAQETFELWDYRDIKVQPDAEYIVWHRVREQWVSIERGRIALTNDSGEARVFKGRQLMAISAFGESSYVAVPLSEEDISVLNWRAACESYA